jgi:DNA-directed RNA polymerase subunit RPC12/RpoP
MIVNTFFICSNCGNRKTFKIFTSNFQIIEQSPELGIRIEGRVLPNLREKDNYIECQSCSQIFDYDSAVDTGDSYTKKTNEHC